MLKTPLILALRVLLQKQHGEIFLYQHQLRKSVNNGSLKSTSWKVLQTVLSYLQIKRHLVHSVLNGNEQVDYTLLTWYHPLVPRLHRQPSSCLTIASSLVYLKQKTLGKRWREHLTNLWSKIIFVQRMKTTVVTHRISTWWWRDKHGSEICGSALQ